MMMYFIFIRSINLANDFSIVWLLIPILTLYLLQLTRNCKSAMNKNRFEHLWRFNFMCVFCLFGREKEKQSICMNRLKMLEKSIQMRVSNLLSHFPQLMFGSKWECADWNFIVIHILYANLLELVGSFIIQPPKLFICKRGMKGGSSLFLSLVGSQYSFLFSWYFIFHLSQPNNGKIQKFQCARRDSMFDGFFFSFFLCSSLNLRAYVIVKFCFEIKWV